MKPKFHHINLSTKNVKEMQTFYKEILFLENEKIDIPKLEKGKAYSGDVEFMTDSEIQTHLAETDNDLCFKTGLEIYTSLIFLFHFFPLNYSTLVFPVFLLIFFPSHNSPFLKVAF